MTGFIAVFAGLLAIVAYVWFRFEWQFALGAIVALTHDVLLVAGIFSLLQLEFDLSIVAALLTILGYSVNDTVVVSDRIRENLRKFKRMDLDELLNLSINETLSRTILTGVHRHRRADLALHLRRRGDPQLQPRHAARRRDRHLLVDLHRRAAAGLPRRQARMGGDGAQAGRRQRRAQGPARERGPQMSPASARYPGRAPIDAYGNGGFRFADMSHRGSILCLPSGIYAWPPTHPGELDAGAFAPVFAEKEALGLLLLGTGRRQEMPGGELRRAFAEAGVALEAMDTGAACRTYNVLLAEGRPVGAALLAVD